MTRWRGGGWKFTNPEPREMKAKFASTCPGCKSQIEPGDDILYYPVGKKAYCFHCTEETRALIADERERERR